MSEPTTVNAASLSASGYEDGLGRRSLEIDRESGAMLEYPADKIARHADIQDAVRTIGQNVDVATCHVEILQDVDGRDKPGHDG